MVNLTESFTKLYNRPPTETELGQMMQMQREQEGFRADRHKRNAQVAAEARKEGKDTFQRHTGELVKCQPKAQDKRPRDEKGRVVKKGLYPQKMPMVARQIDRGLKVGITVSQIAFMLGITEVKVRHYRNKWNMPVRPVDER